MRKANSDLDAPEREVRFVPIKGHRQRGAALPKSATTGLCVTKVPGRSACCGAFGPNLD